ncbi:hypothetical protein MKW92_015631, partial [Papaver armeniacum]
MSRQPQRLYEDSVDRDLDFDTYWKSVSLGPSLAIRAPDENFVVESLGFSPRLLLTGSSSNLPTQQAPLLYLGHLIPSWDLRIPILGTFNMVQIEGGPFDLEGVVGVPLPIDIPE